MSQPTADRWCLNEAEYKELAANLNGAMNRLVRNRGLKEIPDIIGLADLKATWAEQRTIILEHLKENTFQPKKVEMVDLPKDLLTVRPLARLDPVDQIVYEATVSCLQPEIDNVVSKSVYSYRWNRKKYSLHDPVKQWLAMQERGRTLNTRFGRPQLLKTDISSFYENIELNVLFQDLQQLQVYPGILRLLEEILESFIDQNQVWGLPQSCDASGILANVYLLPADNLLTDAGWQFLRYSDDIYIFGADFPSLRRLLIDLNRLLRGRRLHLSAHKTKILQGAEIQDEFENTKDALNYGLNIGAPEAAEELRALFTKALEGNSPTRTRDLKYSINRLGWYRDDFAVEELLRNLELLPHLCHEIVNYLRHFTNSFPVAEKLQSRLNSAMISGYPYAEMHILRLLASQPEAEAGGQGVAWEILRDKNRPTFVREVAARYIGLHYRHSDGALLRAFLRDEDQPRIRRAVLIAAYESGSAPDPWLTSLTHRDSDLSFTSKFLLKHPRLDLPLGAKAR